MDQNSKIAKVLERLSYDKRIHKFWPHHFNTYVITGPIQGTPDLTLRIGRLAQVRLEDGDFGSDQVFLWHCNGQLQAHSNQAFFEVPENMLPLVEELFTEVPVHGIEEEYTLAGENPETGFIIPSKVPEGQSTPMRDITAAIHHEIAKIIAKERL